MKNNALRLLFACIGLALFHVTALAQVAEPQPREEVFSDWRVTCQAKEQGFVCQMQQSVSAEEDGPPVFLLSVSDNEDTGQSYAVITVPVGVYLAPGIELHVDKRRPFKVLYEVCDQLGCHAGFRLNGDVLAAFRKGLEVRARVWTARDKAIDFPVSLRGFTAAYNQFRTAGNN
ncbi:invasion associated locus B family protein [Ruegeria sp. Ofav3-42]|uniref:invasion associated locus B family protein n=1 Tax=Ruegeria sp. Ofav3-42 TaxID=2917759 RepID=UPI001EF4B2D6|nr:invasion associated locus B family protein [Ruegeria sp. Ofav3-42]MCG7521620.1 invasion associated locus B family protein [Ruegeria sp. Ofav3-42]